MLRSRYYYQTLAVLALMLLAGLAFSAGAQQSALGKVDFPVTGSEKARAHFLRGVAALHSFWYEEALEAFRESTRIDPDFAMGYWGEAMAYNHSLWQEQDTEAGRKVLGKLRGLDKVTPRERAYINAVKILYGDGDKQTRDRAYSAAMEKIYHDYPDDLEAAAFYSLSLLGMVRPGEKGFARQMKAAAIALDVFQKNPDHPGAAHYIIHAFDDPEHAILALPAARRYSQIAPEAHHARHMPSHIFIQLGMWPEAAASNESSWATSVEWVKRKNYPITRRDYHSLHWLTYVYLQQGRFAKAAELIAQMQSDIRQSAEVRQRGYMPMAAAYVVETGRWAEAARLFNEEERKDQKAAGDGHAGHAPAATQQNQSPAYSNRPRGSSLPVFVRAMAAISTGAQAEAERFLAELKAMRQEAERENSYRAKIIGIMELEVAALASSARGNQDEAIELMKKATALEEDMSPPSGPPDVIKPSHELFGEILLKARRPAEAAQQFATSLARQPNRARSLLGAARAAAQSGDQQGAAAAYAKFLEIWRQADADLSELDEARAFMSQASSR